MPRRNSYFEQEQELKAWWINHEDRLEAEAEAKWRLENPEAAAAADARAAREEAERQALWDADMAVCKAGAKKRGPKPACKGCGPPSGVSPVAMSPAGVTQASPAGTAGAAPADQDGWTTVGRRRR
jgi:hypothetical protein